MIHVVFLLFHFRSSKPHSRKKRSLDQIFPQERENSQQTSQMAENILQESLGGHKIRNVRQKVASLNDENQIVTAILDEFCPKRTEFKVKAAVER